MNDLKDLIHDIIRELGEDAHYDVLGETDQRKLTSAYIRQHPDVVGEILVDIQEPIARHLARLVLSGMCDTTTLLEQLADAAFPNESLASLIDGEIDWEYRLSQRFSA